ncbi:MAG: hypothetical protein WC455_24120 [Dehalococcoidia bacterium]
MIVELMIRKCSDGTYEVVIPCEYSGSADSLVDAFNQARQADREFERERWGHELSLTTAGRVEDYFRAAKRVYKGMIGKLPRGKSP